jgi:hypothetical protein
MKTLGEDIVLLAIKPDGRLREWNRLRFALAGSELVRLAAAHKVAVVDDRIMVTDPGPLDDALLTAALGDMVRSKRPPKATAWVAGRRQHVVDAYLAGLDAAGVIRTERRKRLGLVISTRWYVVDTTRQDEARTRLDQVARGGPIDSTQAAYGGLVHAIRLDHVLYPGREGKPARERLEQIARRNSAANAPTPAADAAIRASQAATDAAVQAAVQASIDAAVSASVTATHHAGHDGGAAVGGHH